MARSRAALLAAVRQDVAMARGAVRAVLGAAESARAEAHRRYAVVLAAHAKCLCSLTEAREAARLETLDRFYAGSLGHAVQVELLAAICAPASTGASWPAWQPNDRERGDPTGLLRIGTISYQAPDSTGQGRAPRTAHLPALIPLLDHAHLWFGRETSPDQRTERSAARPVRRPAAAGTTAPVDRASTTDGAIAGVLLRALGGNRPGDIRVSVYDCAQSAGELTAFAPLHDAGLLSVVDPDDLTALLEELVGHINRIKENLLAGQYASLAELTAATAGRRPEPWRIAVLLCAPTTELTAPQCALLDRIVRTGVACGIHLIVRDLPMDGHPAVERVRVRGDFAHCDSTGVLPVRLDPAPPADQITEGCRELAARLVAGPPPARLADLQPQRRWAECSAAGLRAPLGADPAGVPVEVLLGDEPPHALIGGPSGSGKTNLLYVWLSALAARYSPDELALYLVDCKQGGSFARLAASRSDPSWLPQVRLVGVNVHSDREFGLGMLRRLGGELRRRARAANHFATNRLAELRAEDPGGHWPRIVAVVDEFQTLLNGRDRIARDTASLLTDLARHGRSQGIHLVLASSDPGAPDALWARTGLITQFTLRIALPKARNILMAANLAAEVIPPFHAVVNAGAGAVCANRIVRLPDASDGRTWRALQETLWRARPDGLAPPELVDGEAAPSFTAGSRLPVGERVDAHTDGQFVASAEAAAPAGDERALR